MHLNFKDRLFTILVSFLLVHLETRERKQAAFQNAAVKITEFTKSVLETTINCFTFLLANVILSSQWVFLLNHGLVTQFFIFLKSNLKAFKQKIYLNEFKI